MEFNEIKPSATRSRAINGGISVCDIVAYQIGWGRLLLGWDKEELDGKNPEMPAKGFKWSELGRLAQSFYKSSEKKSLVTLRREFKDVVEETSDWINKMSAGELFKLGRRKWAGEKWPIVKWIQVNTVAPYSSARTKIRRWKKNLAA